MSARKTNSNAWYADLSDEKQYECYEILKSCGYVRAQIKIAEDFNIRPSIGALSAFYDKFSKQEAEADLIRMVTDVENIEALTAGCEDIDEALRAKLNQAALGALVGGDPEQIKLLVNLALDARSADREDAKLKQRIAEFERKMQAAGDTLDDGKLSPEEKELRIREVLGL